VPLFYQQDINEYTRVAIWQIAESESFFNVKIPLHLHITHPQKRLQHLAGRYLLPYLYGDFPNSEIEIAETRKPFLPNEQYNFSISHCSNYAAAIVSKQERVGVDVEIITPRLHRIKQKFLHPDELAFVNAEHPNSQLTLLSLLWSAKEAMFKWYGSGEVGFSEMMRTQPFKLQDQGEIEAHFLKYDFKKRLTLHYKLFNQLTMVWVASSMHQP
jgi:phosphopantetheinyl transferase